MSSEHKRPLFAFAMVAVICAFFVGSGLRSDAVGGLLRVVEIPATLDLVERTEQTPEPADETVAASAVPSPMLSARVPRTGPPTVEPQSPGSVTPVVSTRTVAAATPSGPGSPEASAEGSPARPAHPRRHGHHEHSKEERDGKSRGAQHSRIHTGKHADRRHRTSESRPGRWAQSGEGRIRTPRTHLSKRRDVAAQRGRQGARAARAASSARSKAVHGTHTFAQPAQRARSSVQARRAAVNFSPEDASSAKTTRATRTVRAMVLNRAQTKRYAAVSKQTRHVTKSARQARGQTSGRR